MDQNEENIGQGKEPLIDTDSAYMGSGIEDELLQGGGEDASVGSVSNTARRDIFNIIGDGNSIGQSDAGILAVEDLLMEFKPPRALFDWKKILDDKNKDEINFKIESLKKKRILFIASENFGTSTSLINHISGIAELKDLHKKEVFFNHAPSKKTFGFVDVIRSCIKHALEGVMIVVKLEEYLKNEFEKAFFHTLIKQQHSDLIKSLQEKNIFFIIIVSKRLAIEIADMDEEQPDNMWLFEKDRLKENKIPEPESFFNTLNPLQKIYVYIATFFKNLSFRDFQTVAGYLLSGADGNEQLIVSRFKEFDDGAKKIDQILPINNREAWECYQDSFLDLCYVEGRFEGGKYVVDFVADGLREKLKKYLLEKQHYFWQRQFELLDKKGLLFNPAINDSIAENLTDLVIEGIKDDPDFYNNEWLFDKLYSITDLEGKPLVAERVEKSFNSFWKPVENKSLSRFFYARLTGILTKMYQKLPTTEAEYFLNSLINAEFHEVLLKLTERLLDVDQFDRFYWVKQLIERGNLSVKTDAYHLLINRLAIKDPDKTWEQVKLWLPKDKALAKYSPSNHYACFFVIHHCVMELANIAGNAIGCFPPLFRLFQPYLQNNVNFTEHFNFIIKQFTHVGTKRQFANNERLVVSKMSLEIFALHWSKQKIIRTYLFIDDRPAADSFADSFVLDYKPRYITLIADIIEAWFQIVKGFGNDYGQEAKELNDFVLGTAVRQLSDTGGDWSGIVNHWQKKPGIYIKQAERIQKRMVDNAHSIDDKDIHLLRSFIDSLLWRQRNMELFFEQLNQIL